MHPQKLAPLDRALQFHLVTNPFPSVAYLNDLIVILGVEEKRGRLLIELKGIDKIFVRVLDKVIECLTPIVDNGCLRSDRLSRRASNNEDQGREDRKRRNDLFFHGESSFLYRLVWWLPY